VTILFALDFGEFLFMIIILFIYYFIYNNKVKAKVIKKEINIKPA